jgi:hypothetical protein
LILQRRAQEEDRQAVDGQGLEREDEQRPSPDVSGSSSLVEDEEKEVLEERRREGEERRCMMHEETQVG